MKSQLLRPTSNHDHLIFFAILCSILLLGNASTASAQDTSSVWQRRAERSRQQYEREMAARRDKILAFARKQHEEFEAAVARAKRRGIPLRLKNESGEVVAAFDGFSQTGMPLYVANLNETSASIIHTDHLWSLPWSLNGFNQDIGLWEVGGRPLESHQEFGGASFSRVYWEDDDPAPYSDHATHVAGTMIAEGVQQQAHGMAPQAEVYAWENTDDTSEMSFASAGPIKLSNHSYGFIRGWLCLGSLLPDCSGGTWQWWGDTSVNPEEDYLFGFYNEKAQEWDQLSRDNPYYLIVKSRRQRPR